MAEKPQAEKPQAEKPQDLIKQRHVEATLAKDKGPDARLLSWAVKDFTQKGDNMATCVTSVEVTYSLEAKDRHVSYVVKLNPQRKVEAMGDMISDILEKEINFYTDILPDLNSALERAGLSRLSVPTFHFGERNVGSEVIFFEDLRARGFKMADRKLGLDAAHVYLVLKELARLHAASDILKRRYGDPTDRHPLLKKDWITGTGEEREFMQKMMISNMDGAVKLLRNIKGYDNILQWTIRNQQKNMDLFQSQLAAKPPFQVICHGDCWNNNFMFRYDDSGAPLEVMLLDLQVTRFASLATDLNYFCFSSVNGSLISSSVQDFLAAYHTSFSQVTEAAGHRVPFSLEELKQEFRDKHIFGLLIGLMAIPFIVMNSDDVPEADDFFSIEGNEEFKQKILDSLDSNPLLRPRFLSVLDYMTEAGVID
ncbi:uncharacterized protein LOC134778968 isoform X2 [Penaeus indicus]|uniref:uncharacterized protein LOC134778968 isoform X2 n=1 Tax=Penaeus indicus TaxID=29960 RepID=UPI00300D64B7